MEGLTVLQQAQVAHSLACERAAAAAVVLQAAQAEMEQAIQAVRQAAGRVANLRAVAEQGDEG